MGKKENIKNERVRRESSKMKVKKKASGVLEK